ncbi:MAG: acetolactate synthase small subunit [Bacteroidota bacterium]|nr:acetolactate synthase small subunit [Bacteroidota bacterium]MDP4226727.1 acetolactate synthase small subunit [Bacteroidota bacterium]MDP4274533.1 acetolactate synthase small subunit [Bacteroidota bacterium]
MEREFTIMAYSENKVGLLSRITIIFTRRHINIESLTVSESEVKGVHRFTIVVRTTEENVIKMVRQIEKLVDVLMASYYHEDEIIFQEIALYKVPTRALAHGSGVEQLIRDNNARILTVEPDYVVIEKTGHSDETLELYKKLEPFGILQFNRSGRIAVTKQIKELSHYLKELDQLSSFSIV